MTYEDGDYVQALRWVWGMTTHMVTHPDNSETAMPDPIYRVGFIDACIAIAQAIEQQIEIMNRLNRNINNDQRNPESAL